MTLKYLLLLLLVLPKILISQELYILEEDPNSIKMKIIDFAKEQNLTLKQTEENSLEVYFDTPEFYLLAQKYYLKYEAKQKLSKKKKNYDEAVYLKTSQPTVVFGVKHYKNTKTIEDKHPLLSLLKRDQREDFKNTLNSNGVAYPMKLKYIFDVSKPTYHYELYQAQKRVSHITLSSYKTKNTTLLNTLTSDGILPDFLKAKKPTKDEMLYMLLHEQISKADPLYNFKIMHPYLIKIIYIIFFCIIGTILIYLLYRNISSNVGEFKDT